MEFDQEQSENELEIENSVNFSKGSGNLQGGYDPASDHDDESYEHDIHKLKEKLNIQNVIFSCPVDHSGTTVHLKGWKSPQNTLTPILFIHDIAENISLYSELAIKLCEKGYNVYAFDLRGHGRSGRLLGHIPHFKQLILDLLQVVAWLKHTENGRLPTILGQGLGALITIYYIQRYDHVSDQLILSAPTLHLATKLSGLSKFIVKMLSDVSPTFRLPHALTPKFNDSVKDFRSVTAMSYIKKPTNLTSNFANEVLKAMKDSEQLLTSAVKERDVLILCPENDKVCDYSLLKELVEQQKSTRKIKLVELEQVGHQFLIDGNAALDKNIDLIVSWLNETKKT